MTPRPSPAVVTAVLAAADAAQGDVAAFCDRGDPSAEILWLALADRLGRAGLYHPSLVVTVDGVSETVPLTALRAK